MTPDAAAINLAIALAMRAFAAGYVVGALVSAGFCLIVWDGRREARRHRLTTTRKETSLA